METSSFQVQPPATDAQVRRAALRGARLALLWSDGTLQAYDMDTAKRQQEQVAATSASLPLRGFAFIGSQVCELRMNVLGDVGSVPLWQASVMHISALRNSGASFLVARYQWHRPRSHTHAASDDMQVQAPLTEAEAKTPKKKRKPLANGTVANGIAPLQPRPAPVSPALALLPGDHAVVVGWEAEGGDGAAAPASGAHWSIAGML